MRKPEVGQSLEPPSAQIKDLTLSIISDIIITELIEKQPIDAYVLELTN